MTQQAQDTIPQLLVTSALRPRRQYDRGSIALHACYSEWRWPCAGISARNATDKTTPRRNTWA
jgi:hypothetical protein